MQYFAYAVAVWLILMACGLPLALTLLPPQLRRDAVPAAPVFGYCYIVFVAYYLYRANVGGTNLYAPFLLVPPLAGLALLALFRWPSLKAAFTCRSAVISALAGASFLAASPFFLLAGGRAVAMSLGNYDIVSYATLARYLQEFARDTHVGFMGQYPYLRMLGDSLWFGPSAVAAIMSSLLQSEPFRLQSVAIAVVACQGAVFVHGIARDGLQLERPAALSLGLLYAINPVLAYTIWDGFGGQTMGASIMLAVVHLVTRAHLEPPQLRPRACYLPALVLLLSGMLLTYNFMTVLVGGLLGLYFLIFALAERSLRRLVAGALLLAAAALLTAVLDPLELMDFIAAIPTIGSPFGWFIAWLSPDVLLGVNTSPVLFGTGLDIGRIAGGALMILLASALAAHLLGRGRRPCHLAFALGLALPVFLLGLYFAVSGAQGGTLGSYRSFKITSTYLAFILLALGIPFGARNAIHRGLVRKLGGAALLAALAAVAVIGLSDMVRVAKAHAYIPPEELLGIRKIEAMDAVSGINVADNAFFDLFWIHYFTLRKPQIYQSFPHAGVIGGPFTEPYTVIPDPGGQPLEVGGILRLATVGCGEPFRLTSKLLLCKRGNNDVMAMLGDGWWYAEAGYRWSGNGGPNADLLLDSDADGTRVQLKARYVALRASDVISLSVNGQSVPLEETTTDLVSAPFALKAGRNIARFSETLPPRRLNSFDPRTFGVAWLEIAIQFADQRAGEAGSQRPPRDGPR